MKKVGLGGFGRLGEKIFSKESVCFKRVGRMKKTNFLLDSNIMLLPSMHWSKFTLKKY